MTNSTIKTLAIALAASGIAFTASAGSMEETFDVTFQIDPSASVEENYEEFERVARAACKPSSMLSVFRTHPRSIRACEADLINKVIAEAAISALTAHHQDRAQQVEVSREPSEG